MKIWYYEPIILMIKPSRLQNILQTFFMCVKIFFQIKQNYPKNKLFIE